MPNSSLDKHDIPYEDGGLVIKPTGEMYILASNDVRLNMYLIALQDILSNDVEVHVKLGTKISEMMGTMQEATNVKQRKDFPRDVKSL